MINILLLIISVFIIFRIVFGSRSVKEKRSDITKHNWL